jgi:hypothetical protein
VAGHVDVRVVARVRLVLDVGDGDRDPALLLLRGGVDLVERREGGVGVLLRQVIAAVSVVLPWSM